MDIKGLGIIFLVILSVFLALTGMFILIETQTVSASLEPEQYVPTHRIVIKLKGDPQKTVTAGSTGYDSLDNLMSRFNVQTVFRLFNMENGNTELKQRLGLSRVYVLSLPSPVNIEKAVSAFSADPNIDYSEKDFVGFGTLIPTDNSFNQQWNLHNTGQDGGEVDADIDAPEAWDISIGVSTTILAIIDSGVDLDHPDLAGKIVPGYDYVNGDDIPQDDHGHGTHVAGIAAANTNNISGTVGVCWQCRIMPLKALNAANWGFYTDWASSIEYAVDNGAHVINMSMGGETYAQFLHDAVIYAYAAKVPIAAAMGNNGNTTLHYPAAFTETIAIGATDRLDDRWGSSSFGNHIDLVAPGSSILSTMWDDIYASWSGTSMATPHVVGVLGLIRSIYQGYTIEVLRNILRTTADDQVGSLSEDTPGWDIYFGDGRLNSAQALSYSAELLLQDVTIGGPTTGLTQTAYIFSAAVSSITATQPITYMWQADSQFPITHTNGLSDTVIFTWNMTGTKVLSVTASNIYNTVTDTNVITISVPKPSQSNFTASTTSGISPLTVVFTNTSSGDYVDSLWGFGDGITNTLTSPSHIYTTPGVYTVTLTVNGSGGTDTITHPNYITAYAPAQADFTASIRSGIAPLTAAFTNTSSGDYSDSLWGFGDGITNTLTSPNHIYTTPGVYTVTLTVNGSGGTDTITHTNYITAYTPVQADFTASTTNGNAPLTVVFSNTSSGDYIDSLWDFGDGITNTLTNPKYTYAAPGFFTIRLTVSGGLGGIDIETKVAYIDVEDYMINLPLVLKNP